LIPILAPLNSLLGKKGNHLLTTPAISVASEMECS
jgi:hypothetical protein